MNRTYDIGRGFKTSPKESGRRAREARRAVNAPAWLVLICRFIVWLTNDETVGLLRSLAAIAAVTAVALVAGAIEIGAISCAGGTVLCLCLGAVALLASREG